VCGVLGFINSENFAQENQTGQPERLTGKLVELTRKPFDETKKERESTTNALVALGDAAIPALINSFDRKDQEFGARHEIITTLARIGSDSARENLKRIAVSESKDVRDNLKEWAANRFFEVIKTKSEAVPLLDSNVPGVKTTALLAISGMPLNGELVSKIGPLLNSEVVAVRWAAIKAYEEDPCETFYSQKIKYILIAADDPCTYGDFNKVARLGQYNEARISLQNYINALSNMHGPLIALQQTSQDVKTDLAKGVLIIARANRKDASVKPGIISIIKEPNNDFMLRLSATGSMGEIGTSYDVPFLQSVADTDPYGEKNYATPVHEMIYPVREVAKTSIQKIHEKAK
jgi:hypothetical protein